MMVGDHALANMFQEIKVEISLTESEKICLYHMTHNQSAVADETSTQVLSTIPSQPDNLLTSMELLVSLLDKISTYVDEVVSGSRAADPAVGILLADVLGSLQVVDPADFQAFFADKMQDMLMVSYISSLTATQLAVAERLICLL
jgi:translation initiation factor 3 subunit F